MAGQRYDVAVLGSGIGGSMLACILAKRGLTVVLVEGATHPRFAIGESLIPETGVRLRIIAEKYGIPEIGWLATFQTLRDRISPACGVKRSFSFLHHDRGARHQPGHVNQLPTLTPPVGPDSHLFRQDTDAYFAGVAVRYGARLVTGAPVTAVKLNRHGVTLTTATHGDFEAEFLIDASGMKSLVSDQLGLRDPEPRFRTNTRAIYTHMVGVPPADALLTTKGRKQLASPLGQATMHHVFDGGWIWVIPFGNHRYATNQLTSVGMLLDRRKYPDPTGAPADEFRAVASQFPSIAQHFANASAVRPWVGTGRLQYSSSRMVADRMIQLPHAAAFLDPLYSSGMSVLTVAVDQIAGRLLTAFEDRRFGRENFVPVESFVNRAFDHYDLVVSHSFDAFAHWELWNAWNRNWAIGNMLGTFGSLSVLMRYLASRDPAILEESVDPLHAGVLGSQLPEVVELMRRSAEHIAEAAAGRASPAAAGAEIFRLIGAADFLPPYLRFGDPDGGVPTFTLQAGARHVTWYRTQAPEQWRRHCDFPLSTYSWHALGYLAGTAGQVAGRLFGDSRDVVRARNHELPVGPDTWQPDLSALATAPLTTGELPVDVASAR
ncbi:MAG: tetracycline 7-halogenase / O2-dependent halogenase [Pseudonocardiales bacterium]|jgi:FADH2 O2-dependent halogenase|nr:tetracycline 7-halogenase / O2-dependent halogenase [Pseudonocardiales bacterium]